MEVFVFAQKIKNVIDKYYNNKMLEKAIIQITK